MQMIKADEGYFFGLGVFETIAVENGHAVFLEEHYSRLRRAVEFLGISADFETIEAATAEKLKESEMKDGRMVLKITVSGGNMLITTRENTYTVDKYEKGYSIGLSRIKRNETSELVYHKTLNYGDMILEKRKFMQEGIDEPIFLNTKGELSEGASANVFIIKGEQISTPPITCGMLPGIMRKHILKKYGIQEKIISREDLLEAEEIFLTNSLMGVMPVRSFEGRPMKSMEISRQLSQDYLSEYVTNTAGN